MDFDKNKSDRLSFHYVQNRINWCWAATAKIVGMHYKEICPSFNFSIVADDNFRIREGAYVSPEEYHGGVITDNPDGLRTKWLPRQDGIYRVDAWQRAIVIEASKKSAHMDLNVTGDETDKIRALKYVVTGNCECTQIQVISIGYFNDALPLIDMYRSTIHSILIEQNWAIGNYIIMGRGIAHSVVLIPQDNLFIRIYDPWDGFTEIYTVDQIFRTGFLTSLGAGIVKWIQYIVD